MSNARMTTREFHATQAKPKRRTIADAVAHKVAAQEGANAGEMASAGASEGRKVRYVVGLDPGVSTGFAVWDREGKRLLSVETSDFWTVFFRISQAPILRPETTRIIIEVAHKTSFTFGQRRNRSESQGTMDRMARNVGQVMREAQLLVEGFRRLGYEVIEQKPLGKAKNAADDRSQFERLTGWTERTSQHARDAARICFGA